MKFVIFGWYGAGNYGDELLLQKLIQYSHKNSIEVCVLSYDAAYTQKVHHVEAIDALDYPGIAKSLQTATAFILGGGGLFQTYSRFTIAGLFDIGVGDIAAYARPVMMAKQLDVPVIFWAQGLGPLDQPEAELIVRDVARASHMISVRDEKSCQILEKLGVQTRITIAPDPGWQASPLPLGQRCGDQAGQRKVLGIAIRPWSVSQDWPVRMIKSLQTSVAPAEWTINWIVTQSNDIPGRAVSDASYVESLKKQLDGSYLSIVTLVNHPDEMQSCISNCDALISMRLHVQILALKLSIPVLCVEYDPKMTYTSELALVQAQRRLSTQSTHKDWDQAVLNLLQGGMTGESEKIALIMKESEQHFELLDGFVNQLKSSEPHPKYVNLLANADWIGILTQYGWSRSTQDLRSTLQHAQSSLAQSRLDADFLQSQVSDLTNTLDVAMKRNLSTEARLVQMEKSRSWRFTKPLRTLFSQVYRVLKRFKFIRS
jgi:polysaccharide pyruvyl transferase CsaB